MGCVIISRKSVSHRVVNTEANIGEAHSRNILTESHTVTAFLAVLNSVTERAGDNLNSLNVEHIRKLPSTLSYVALNSVGKSVHTCSGGKSGGHCSHHIRVYNCNNGNIVNINANELTLFLNICNNIVDSNLSGSTCCGGNSDNRNALVLCGSYTLKRTDILKLGVGDDNTDSLCGIHRRAAADCNNAVSSASLELLNAVLNILNGGVSLNIGIKLVLYSRIIENICNLLCNAEFYKVGIRSNKGFFKAAAFNLVRNGVNCTRTVIGGLIQHKFVHRESPFLYKFYHLIIQQIFC